VWVEHQAKALMGRSLESLWQGSDGAQLHLWVARRMLGTPHL
jgi:hypothetical protein